MQESGLEAAAATAVVLHSYVTYVAAAPTITITVDHPYLIAIIDVPTGAILFLGHVTDPTAT